MKTFFFFLTFLIAQSSIAEIGITPTAKTFSRDGGFAVIVVSGSGEWQASTEDGWITLFTTSGNGAGNIVYSPTANTTADTRQGTILVNDKVFTITQNGYESSISPSFSDFTESGGTGTVNVTVGPGISWSAVSNVSWIEVDSESGLSSGQVEYTVEAYEGVQTRSGSMTIAGKTFDVTQTGGDLALSPSSASLPYRATAIPNIGVEALSSTTWSVQSNVSWISVVDPGRGSGDSAITIGVGENPSYLDRVGTVSIGSKTFTVTQEGTPNLRLDINPKEATADASGAVGNVAVLATPDAPWSADSLYPWIIVDQGNTGAGNGNISYVVTPNTNLEERIGQIRINPPAPKPKPDLDKGLLYSSFPYPARFTGEVVGEYVGDRREYTMIRGSYSWQDAKADAEAKGGRLAVLNTQEKIEIASAALRSGSFDAWIGLTDEAQEGRWEWITGEPLTASDWQGGAPNGSTGENYAIINGSLNWNDVSGDRGYLLETPSDQDESGWGRSLGLDNALTGPPLRRQDDSFSMVVDFKVEEFNSIKRLSEVTRPDDSYSTIWVNSSNEVVFRSGSEELKSIPLPATGNYRAYVTASKSHDVKLVLFSAVSEVEDPSIISSAGRQFSEPPFPVDIELGDIVLNRSNVPSVGKLRDAGIIGYKIYDRALTQKEIEKYDINDEVYLPDGPAPAQHFNFNGSLTPTSGANFAKPGVLTRCQLDYPGKAFYNGDFKTDPIFIMMPGATVTARMKSTSDGDGSTSIDVHVAAEDGTRLKIDNIQNGRGDSRWSQRTYDLSRWAGQTIRIVFTHIGTTQNLTFVDWVSFSNSLNVSQAGALTVKDRNGIESGGLKIEPGLDLLKIGGSYGRKTFTSWLRFDSTTDAEGVISLGPGFDISNGRLFFGSADLLAIEKDRWIHLAFATEPDGFYRVYYNGEEVGSGQSDAGASLGVIGMSFDGAVDMVSTYDDALSSAQIRSIYESQKPQTYFHTITQGAFQPSIDPVQASVSSSGGSASTNLTLSQNVQWAATTTTSWLTITSSTTGAGSADIRVSADPNPTVYERTGTVLVAGQTFSIIQPGLNVDLEYELPIFTADGGDFLVDVNTEAGAAWEATSDSPWIIIPNLSGEDQNTGSGSVAVVILPYADTTNSRTGILYLAGQEVIISQRGYDLSVSPQIAEVGSNAGAGEFGVAAPLTAVWEAIVTTPWITLIGGQDGRGNGTVRYSLGSNTTGAPRTGKIIVAGEEYVITQYAGIDVTVTAASNGTTTGTGSYDTNANATLTATADQGYVFSHWTGDAVGSDNPLELIVDSNKNVVANFVPDSAVAQFQQPILAQIQVKDEVIEQKNSQLQANTLTIEDLQNGISEFAATNVVLQTSLDNAIAQRNARFVDSDEDGITDVKETELETDPQEVTAFYLEAADPLAIETARLAGRSEVISAPQNFNLYTSSQYNSVVTQRDARPTQTAYEAVIAQRDARFVDSDEDGITDVKETELETDPQEVTAFYLEAADPLAIETARLAGRSEVISAPQNFNLYTSSQYNSVVTQRDARPADSDGDGLTNEKEAELGTDLSEETVFYLKAAFDTAVDSSRQLGRNDVTGDPASYRLIGLGAYNTVVVQRDARPTQAAFDSAIDSSRQLGRNDVTGDPASYSLIGLGAYNTVVVQRDARPTQAAFDTAVDSSRQLGRDDVTGDPASYSLVDLSTYSAVVAQRDARPTQVQCDVAALEALTEGRNQVRNNPTAYQLTTLSAYNLVVRERDARPTLAEIQDARPGATLLTPNQDGMIEFKLDIEETNDLEAWSHQGKSVEAGFPLEPGKKFFRFSLQR